MYDKRPSFIGAGSYRTPEGTATMDIATLGLEIRSDGVVVAKNRLRDFDNQAARSERSAAALGAAVGKAFALISAALSVKQLVGYADAWSDMQSRVGAAIKDMDAAPAMMQRMVDLANASYSPLDQTVEVYARNVAVLKDLGISAAGAADFTESLNHMLVITATKGERAASVQNALSKAMATGKLQAEGLETILANGGRVAEALAGELGTTVSGLRKMASEGKITGKVISEALLKSLEDVRAEAAEMPATIGDAFTRIQTNLTALIGTLDQTHQVSSRVAEAILTFADNIEIVIPIAGALATLLTVAMIPAITSATVSFALLTAAMLANPFVQLALVAGTLAGALIYLNQHQGLAAQAAQTHAEALVTNANAIETAKTSSQGFRDGLRSQIALQLKAAEAALNEAGAQYKAAEARAAFGQKFGDAMAIGARMFGMPGPDGDYGQGRGAEMAQDTIDRALQGINAAMDRVTDFKEQLGSLSDVETNYKPVEHTLATIGELSKAAAKAAEKYKDLVRGAHEFVAAQQLEAQALGMTAEAANRMRYEQDMLNQAANDNIKLTPKMREEIGGLAQAMAAAEEATRRLTEIYSFGKDVFTGFFGDLKSGITEGKSLWESLGNAATNALDKIADKALSMAANGIFDMIFGAVMGGLTGGMGNSLGGGWGVAGGFGKPGIFGIPGFADGTNYAPGGMAWVGERGPELVNLPRGARVIPNGPSMALASNGNGSNDNAPVVIHNHMQVMPGATEEDGAAFARGVTKELKRQLPDAIKNYNNNNLRRTS